MTEWKSVAAVDGYTAPKEVAAKKARGKTEARHVEHEDTKTILLVRDYSLPPDGTNGMAPFAVRDHVPRDDANGTAPQKNTLPI